jgi:hypothetical protein
VNSLRYRVVIYDECLVLYEDHRSTCACRLRCSKILASQEQDQSTLSPKIPDGSVSMRCGKGQSSSHELANIS